MSEFEYLIVIISIVYSLVLVRLINGVVEIVGQGGQDLIHTSWLVLLLQGVFLNWWLFWTFNEVEWQYGYYLLAIMVPVLMYYVAAVLVPNDLAAIDWRRHFDATHRQVFLGTAGVIALNEISEWVIKGGDILSVYNAFPAILIALLIVSAVFDSRRLHGAITAVLLLCYTMITLLFVVGA